MASHNSEDGVAKRMRADSDEKLNLEGESTQDGHRGDKLPAKRRKRQYNRESEGQRRQEQKNAWDALLNTVIKVNEALPKESQVTLTRNITANMTGAVTISRCNMVECQMELVQNSIDLLERLNSEREEKDMEIQELENQCKRILCMCGGCSQPDKISLHWMVAQATFNNLKPTERHEVMFTKTNQAGSNVVPMSKEG